MRDSPICCAHVPRACIQGKRFVSPSYGAAAHAGHEEGVRVLLDSGASVAATVTATGWTALHAAAARGQEGIAKLLVKKGGDVRQGETEFHLCYYSVSRQV